MPSTFRLLVAALCAVCLNQSIASAKLPNDWLHDYTKARQLASEHDRPLLLHFHATWCSPCRTMESTVLHTGEVKRLLGKDVIAVKIDSDRHPELISKFGISSLPSDVIIGTNGAILKRSSGFQNKNSYSTMIVRAAAMHQPKTPAQIVVDSAESDEEAPTDEQTPNLQPLIGLDGFSPIVLMDERRWVPGSEEFSHTHKGIEYHMQSAEELTMFKSDPARYAPRLLECDPVELWKTDQAVRGSTKFGAYFDGQLYLFTDFDNRETFKKSPLKYTETQHVLKASEIIIR